MSTKDLITRGWLKSLRAVRIVCRASEFGPRVIPDFGSTRHEAPGRAAPRFRCPHTPLAVYGRFMAVNGGPGPLWKPIRVSIRFLRSVLPLTARFQ